MSEAQKRKGAVGENEIIMKLPKTILVKSRCCVNYWYCSSKYNIDQRLHILLFPIIHLQTHQYRFLLMGIFYKSISYTVQNYVTAEKCAIKVTAKKH